VDFGCDKQAIGELDNAAAIKDLRFALCAVIAMHTRRKRGNQTYFVAPY
jgi:hypothetical protein